MKIIDDLLTNNRPYTKRTATKGIVIHYVGNPNTSAKANRNYLNTPGINASCNYIVGLKGEIICCIPDEEISWCSGWTSISELVKNKFNGNANNYTVSIETCHTDTDGRYTAETWAAIVELTVMLCKKYGLTENDLYRHYDCCGDPKKNCPMLFVKFPAEWEKFKTQVKEKL